MNSPFYLLSLSGVLALAGCAAPGARVPREPYVKPGLVMVTPDQARRYGLPLTAAESERPDAAPSALDTSAVLQSPAVTVYTLGRVSDPNDPALMHEEHVVYRRETAPRWRLNAPAEQKILIGPRITDGRQDLQPLLSKEVTTYLTDARRSNEAHQQAITTLFQAVDSLQRQQQTLLERDIANQHRDAAADQTAIPTALPEGPTPARQITEPASK